ncbi:MAG: anti-sigma factor antagonist [Candidatus Acidiferrales bacterium]
MNLALQSETVGKVVVIRCQGRIVTGDETLSLQQEIERHARATKKIVLQMAEVKYVDSGGLGALVRIAGVLRSYHGDLKLCQISSFVHQVLQATGLLKVFHTYASEKEAVDAFLEGPQSDGEAPSRLGATVLCIDTSLDLLAYLSALLKRSGYEVITTKTLVDAKMLVNVTRPDVAVCGPGLQANEFAIENLRESAPKVPFLMLSSDFSTTDASHAGLDLVERLHALLNPPQP